MAETAQKIGDDFVPISTDIFYNMIRIGIVMSVLGFYVFARSVEEYIRKWLKKREEQINTRWQQEREECFLEEMGERGVS